MADRSEHHAYLIILGCVALWCAALFVPPIIAYVESPSQDISGISYRCFSPVCHQFETRSLTVFGHKLAVCARCSGIYFGVLAGVLLFPFIRFRQGRSLKLMWLIALSPMMADGLLNFFGIHASSAGTRLTTGAFFGIGSSFILLPLAIEAVRSIIFHPSHQQGVQYESKTR